MRKQSNVTWTLILLILVSAACGSETPESLSATLPPAPTSTQTAALTSTLVYTSTAETPIPVSTSTPAPLTTPIGGGSGKIAFISNYGGETGIYLMDLDGSNPARNLNADNLTRLTQGSAQYCCLAWSPDGSKIAFSSLSGERWDIYVMNSEGSGETRLTTERTGHSPSWSPDGSQIVFQSDAPGSSEIYVMRADGSHQTRLTNNDMFNSSPAWSPHGTKIAYESKEKEVHTSAEEIYVMNADGSDPVQLTFNDVQDFQPAWSPDGTKIAYSTTLSHLSAEYNPDIYVMNYDGSKPIRLTSDRTHEGNPRWSPDGMKIIFPSCLADILICDIYMMNADGSGQSQLTDFNRFTHDAAWIPLLQNAITGHPDCSSGWTHLKAGDQARVSQETKTPNRVRAGPGTTDEIIGLLDPGTVVKVLEGPVCADGLIFWKVENKSIPGGAGWTAEGDGAEYWLELYVP